MKKLFKRIIFWIKNKFHRANGNLTDKGFYMCYYIVNKYINQGTCDDNTNYEVFIEQKLEQLNQISFFDRFENSETFTLLDKRNFAAQNVLANILYNCNKNDREKVYSYIESDKDKYLICQLINKGLIL